MHIDPSINKKQRECFAWTLKQFRVDNLKLKKRTKLHKFKTLNKSATNTSNTLIYYFILKLKLLAKKRRLPIIY